MGFLDKLANLKDSPKPPAAPQRIIPETYEIPLAPEAPIPLTTKHTFVARQVRDLWETYLEIEQRLVAAGWPKTSDYWLAELEAFYAGNYKRFVARVGRRGGKTSTLCRVVANEVLYSGYAIPPGDIGTFVIISKDREDARDKLVQIGKILDALGIDYKQTLDEITLANYPVRIKSLVATISGVVSITSIGILEDEVSRWRDTKSGANPAKEVLASLRPSMKTQPTAHEFMISSPWGMDDVHYYTVEEGTTAWQYVTIAPTWVANPLPSCTEEACRAEEPDAVIFAREFGAIPMPAGAGSFYDMRIVSAAMCAEIPPWTDKEPPIHVAGLDLGFVNDHAAISIGRIEGDVIREVFHRDAAPSTEGFTAKLQSFIDDALRYNCRAIMCDNHYREAVREQCNKYGIILLNTKPPDVMHLHVKRKLSENKIILLNSKTLRKQLLSITSFPSAGGKIHINLPRKVDGHCDLASAVVAMAYQDYGMVAEAPEKPHPLANDEMFQRSIARFSKKTGEVRYEGIRYRA